MLALSSARHAEFDYDLLALQAKGTESVEWEKTILESSGRSGFVALTTARSLDELRRKEHAFQALPSVAKVDSLLMLVPDRQPAKLALLHGLGPIVADIALAPPAAPDVARFTAALGRLGRRTDVAVKEAEGADRAEALKLDRAVRETLAAVAAAPTGAVTDALATLGRDLRDDFADKLRLLQRNAAARPVTVGDVPDELRHKFVGRSGRFLVEVQPAVDVRDRAALARTVSELRGIDPT